MSQNKAAQHPGVQIRRSQIHDRRQTGQETVVQETRHRLLSRQETGRHSLGEDSTVGSERAELPGFTQL